MSARDLIPVDHIWPRLSTAGRRDLFGIVGETASAQTGVSAAQCVEALMAREKLGSTALGRGAAFPHAQLANLSEPLVFLATLSTAIDFRAPDRGPVDIVLTALVPEGFIDEQVRLVARCVRLLRQDEVLEQIRTAETRRDIERILGNTPLG